MYYQVGVCARSLYCQGGPCARSCHKMCLDATNKQMFFLGRYLESALRTADNLRVSVINVVTVA